MAGEQKLLAIGEEVGPYTVTAHLRSTGVVHIYLGKHRLLGREVFLKVPQGESTERIYQTARILVQLQHPNIAVLHDLMEVHGKPCMVEAHVEGRPLHEIAEREGSLTVPVALRITAKIAGALDYAHKNGVIHRDIKPGNILISNGGEPLLTNFEVAAPLEGDPLSPSGLAGTPPFMAPEQARGERATPHSDIWGMGTTLFCLLNEGKRPLDSELSPADGPEWYAPFLARLRDPDPLDLAPLRAKVPQYVFDIVQTCLQKDPRRRYSDAGVLKRALDAAIDQLELQHSATMVAPPRPQPGQSLLLYVEYSENINHGAYRQYRLDRFLGEGQFGEVYAATDEIAGKVSALKFLKQHWIANDDMVQRFRREARFLSRLSHPNILTLRDFGRFGPTFFISMDLLDGPTLQQTMEQSGPMDLAAAVRSLDAIMSGLAALHDERIVHRDLKPANIATLQGRLVICDLGLAYAQDFTKLTASGAFVGTARYMAPEQANCKPVGAFSDIYSAGVIFYEMLSGRHPHESDSLAGLIGRIINDPPVPISRWRHDLPIEVAQLLDRMLDKSSQNRPDARQVRMLLTQSLCFDLSANDSEA